MSRIRTIKPETFTHEELFDSEKATGLPLRLAYIGLWTACDREGRFLWRPRQLKTDILPYDDDIDFSRVLDALWTRGFLVKYASDGNLYGCIPTWGRHQFINNREKESDLPAPTEDNIVSIEEKRVSVTRTPRVSDACPTRPSLSPSSSLSPSLSENKKEFDEFWRSYPHKVGKRDAERAFGSARKRHSMQTILDGVAGYVASKPPDRPWCNPSTWLHQDRCLDQPAVVATSPPKTRTELAFERIKARNGNGFSGSGLRDGSGEVHAELVSPAGSKPGNLRIAVDNSLRREAEDAVAEDGESG